MASTHEVVCAYHQITKRFVASGLNAFMPASPLRPLQVGESTRIVNGKRLVTHQDGTEEVMLDIGVWRKVWTQLICISDSGSNMFAAYLQMLKAGVNAIWYGGPCHQASRCSINTMTHAGLGEHRTNITFMSKFNYGPFQEGGGGSRNKSIQREVTTPHASISYQEMSGASSGNRNKRSE